MGQAFLPVPFAGRFPWQGATAKCPPDQTSLLVCSVRMLLVLVLGLLASTTSFAQTAEPYRQKALEFSRDKSWDQAIENYRKALAIEPEDADTHYNLALTLKYKGEPRAAVEEFRAVVRLRPKWADAHYGLGATWYDLHDQQAALEELRTAIHLDPANAGARRILARIYLEQSNPAAAATELRQIGR